MNPTIERPALTLEPGLRARVAAFNRLDDGTRAAAETPLIRELVLEVGRSRRGGEFTADDLRPVLPFVNMNRVGRVFAQLKREGRIVEVGWRPSRVPSAHGRKVGVYVLASHLINTRHPE